MKEKYLILHNGMIFNCPFETEEEARQYGIDSGFKPFVLLKIIDTVI